MEMAQWLGQFSGRTHATKVLDVEETLRDAVQALAEHPIENRASRLQAIMRLCGKLLTARRKQIKAANARQRENLTGKFGAAKLALLRASEEEFERAGAEAILKEFGVDKLLAESAPQGGS